MFNKNYVTPLKGKYKISSDKNDELKNAYLLSNRDLYGFRDKYMKESVNGIYPGMDECDLIDLREYNGCKYLLMYSASDDQSYIYSMLWFDGKDFQVYVPIKGNAVNTLSNDILSDWGSKAEEYCKQEDIDIDSINEYGYLDNRYDKESCIKEFESLFQKSSDKIKESIERIEILSKIDELRAIAEATSISRLQSVKVLRNQDDQDLYEVYINSELMVRASYEACKKFMLIMKNWKLEE